MDALQTGLEGKSLEELFAEFDALVATRPYLQESDDTEDESLENLFAEFDALVATRPYLQG
jgi:ribosomal protein L12E/L44/L45/RPP1/RPP2